MAERGELAISVCYTVKVDGEDLGEFTTCEGLGCEIVLEQREEGGNNGFVWQLPTRIKYSNIKLTRPICADSANLTKWLAGFASGVKLRTATIEARGADGKVVTSWNLDGALPVRWTGPSLNPESAQGRHGDDRTGAPRVPVRTGGRPVSKPIALLTPEPGAQEARKPHERRRRPGHDAEGDPQPLRRYPPPVAASPVPNWASWSSSSIRRK